METPLEIDIHTAAELLKIQGQVQLLDVREANEWDFCHVAGSQHIPMGQIPGRLDELPRDKPILVLCHHGGRSLRVTQFLRANDFPLSSNVSGGINAWASSIDPSLGRY